MLKCNIYLTLRKICCINRVGGASGTPPKDIRKEKTLGEVMT